MALMLILQLLTLWPLCHTDVTSNGTQEAQGPRLPMYLVPPAFYSISSRSKSYGPMFKPPMGAFPPAPNPDLSPLKPRPPFDPPLPPPFRPPEYWPFKPRPPIHSAPPPPNPTFRPLVDSVPPTSYPKFRPFKPRPTIDSAPAPPYPTFRPFRPRPPIDSVPPYPYPTFRPFKPRPPIDSVPPYPYPTFRPFKPRPPIDSVPPYPYPTFRPFKPRPPINSVPPYPYPTFRPFRPRPPIDSVPPYPYPTFRPLVDSVPPTSYPKFRPFKPRPRIDSVPPYPYPTFRPLVDSVPPTSYPKFRPFKPRPPIDSVPPYPYPTFRPLVDSVPPTSYPKFRPFRPRPPIDSVPPYPYPTFRPLVDSVPPTSYPKFRPFKPRPRIDSVPPAPYPKFRPPIVSDSPNSYPKPSLGAQPAAVVTPGINVTLTCRAPLPARRFALFKSGEIVTTQDGLAPLAQFFLEEVTEAQGGSYRCRYQKPGFSLSVWSNPSDALELLVTDQLPTPSLAALPGPVVAPGSNVSLRCASRMANMSYALYRAGQETPLQYLQAQQPSWADFPLSGARAAGTYTCYYHTPTAPYVLSQSSEPLVITLEGSGTLDYTKGNLIRLGLGGLVLIFLAMLGTLELQSWRRNGAGA